MTLRIFIGRIRRANSTKFTRLKLGDPVNEGDFVKDETLRGLRCIRAVAVLTAKEAGKRKVKTWTLRTNSPNAAGDDIKRACQVEAEKWKQKILAKLNGQTETEEVLTQTEL